MMRRSRQISNDTIWGAMRGNSVGINLILALLLCTVVAAAKSPHKHSGPGDTSSCSSNKQGRASVRINAEKIVSRISPYLYGLNVARWDEDLFPGPASDMLLDCDRDAIRKVKNAGAAILKYPGGNDADHYTWNSRKNSAGEMNTDEFAALLKVVGAQGFITVNFNESPRLAADWVRYCNKENDYDIKYWEVGDEQWGSWAAGHTTPEKYADRFIEFAKAMKAVDPTIRIAADVKPSDDMNDWTCRVLKVAGNYVDLVTFSYYPLTNKEENADSLFASVPTYRRDYEAIRRALQESLPIADPLHGKERADTMWIADVGYNSISGRPGPITLSIENALWMGDLLGNMAELGEKISCYWALHNSYPPRGGDYGLLSEDGKNTPSYDYYVFSAYSRLFGDKMVQCASSDSTLSVYSSLKGRDTLSVILINKNKRKSEHTTVRLAGFREKRIARAWILDSTHKLDGYGGLRSSGRNLVIDVPPYSFVVLHLFRQGLVPPPLNLALHSRATASTFARNGPNFGASSAVDGRLYTRWASAALWGADSGHDRQWFMTDLGRVSLFDSVVIHWADGYAIKYSLEISSDGRKWERVYSEENGRGGTEQIRFAPVRARFVRLRGFEGSQAISTYSIYEFQVFNSQFK